MRPIINAFKQLLNLARTNATARHHAEVITSRAAYTMLQQGSAKGVKWLVQQVKIPITRNGKPAYLSYQDLSADEKWFTDEACEFLTRLAYQYGEDIVKEDSDNSTNDDHLSHHADKIIAAATQRINSHMYDRVISKTCKDFWGDENVVKHMLLSSINHASDTVKDVIRSQQKSN